MNKRPIVLDPLVPNVVFRQQVQDAQTGVEMPNQCSDTKADVSLTHPHFIGEVRHLMIREFVVQGDRAQQLLLSQALEFRVAAGKIDNGLGRGLIDPLHGGHPSSVNLQRSRDAEIES
ncbi:hypothetical protein D3C81_1878120 [compost metagenome]